MAKAVQLPTATEDTPHARIVAALKPFDLQEKDEKKAANKILSTLKRLHARHQLTDYETYLDFDKKLKGLAQQFINEEPDFKKFVSAAIKDPHLFFKTHKGWGIISGGWSRNLKMMALPLKTTSKQH